MALYRCASGGGGGNIGATLTIWQYGTNGRHYVFSDGQSWSDASVPYTASTASVLLDNDYVKIEAITGTGQGGKITLKKPCTAIYQTASLGNSAGYSTAQSETTYAAGDVIASSFGFYTHAVFIF